MEGGSLKNLDYNYKTSQDQNIPTSSAGSETGTISSDYVFGSNISSRVINTKVSQGASTNLWNNSQDSCDSVFTTLANALKSTDDNKNAKNLEESAKEVVDDRSKDTLNLREVDLYTGEEGENQIIRQHCRAYMFDNEKQKWNNLGAVHFHLNDIPPDDVSTVSRSRIVVRLASTRKLVINTLIWNNMPVALADSRNLRISAITEGCEGIKSYVLCFPSGDSASRILDLINKRKSGNTVPVNSNSSNNNNRSFVHHKHQLPNDSSTIPHKISINGPMHQTDLFYPSVLSQNNTKTSQTLDKNVDIVIDKKVGDAINDEINPKATIKTNDTNQSPLHSESCVTISSVEHSDKKLPEENESNPDLNNNIYFDESILEEYKQTVFVRMEDELIDKMDKPLNISVYNQNVRNLVLNLQCHLCMFDHVKKEWKNYGSAHISLHDINTNSECGVVSKMYSQLVIDDYDQSGDSVCIPIESDADISLANNRYIRLMAFSYSKNNFQDIPNLSLNAFVFLTHSNNEANSLFKALKARKTNVIDHDDVCESNLSKLEPEEECVAE